MKEPFNEGSFFIAQNIILTIFREKDAKHLFPRHKQTYLYNLYPKTHYSRKFIFVAKV
jgi:hypothetical protein